MFIVFIRNPFETKLTPCLSYLLTITILLHHLPDCPGYDPLQVVNQRLHLPLLSVGGDDSHQHRVHGDVQQTGGSVGLSVEEGVLLYHPQSDSGEGH